MSAGLKTGGACCWTVERGPRTIPTPPWASQDHSAGDCWPCLAFGQSDLPWMALRTLCTHVWHLSASSKALPHQCQACIIGHGCVTSALIFGLPDLGLAGRLLQDDSFLSMLKGCFHPTGHCRSPKISPICLQTALALHGFQATHGVNAIGTHCVHISVCSQ